MTEDNKILVLGSINMGIHMYVNKIPNPWETIEATSTLFETDGKGSRIATAIAKLGASASIIAKVGTDSYGSQVLETLEQSGINIQHVSRTEDTPTGIVMLIRDNKKQTSLINSPGANLEYVEGEITKLGPFIAEHKIMVITNNVPLFSIREALQIARKHNILVLLDPSPASEIPDDIYKDVDILLPNESDIKYMAGVDTIDLKSSRMAISSYMELGVKKTVILKVGTDGVLIKSHNQFIVLGSVDMTDEVDRKGDKNIFTAALAVSFANKDNTYESATYAKAAAQLSDVKPGVRAILPTKEAIWDHLHENPPFEEIIPYE